MLQTIKKISFAVLFTALTVATVQAQNTKKMKPKKHTCTEACANGKHMYKHGEKGHKCTDDCKKTTANTMELKDHVCTAACHNAGHCVMAHGEKGHTCDVSCKSKM